MDRLLGFFSGFPSHHFPGNVAERLCKEIIERRNLVFVSAWPADHAKTESDAAGMNQMFEEIGICFEQYDVIDNRTEPLHAAQLICEASCVWLMGGHPGQQMQLLRGKNLDAAIGDARGALLGVSAGAINMAVRSLDTKESLVPYPGLGLADITVKPHFEAENQEMRQVLTHIAKGISIYAMEDDSAIFVAGGHVSSVGNIHRIHDGCISPIQAIRASCTDDAEFD